MRAIGLHLRSTEDFSSVIDKAAAWSMPIFQAFFKNHEGTSIGITAELITHYERLHHNFSHRVVHASYSINLADKHILSHASLKRELYCAQALQFSHLLFHPGAVPPLCTRHEALDMLVKNLNTLSKREPHIQFVLENSAHGKRSLGGNFEELAYVQARLDSPEKVSFCIDTAHAHVFGYSIDEENARWVEMVTSLLTPEAIVLLHINDTHAARGSCDDRHCAPGRGKIGVSALKAIMNHPLFKSKPLILELPALSEESERSVLEEVRLWEQGEKLCV